MTNPLSFDATRLASPHLNDGHEAWRKTVRTFVDREIMPHVNDWDEAGAFPRDLHRKAADIGLIGLGYPEEYGGVSEDVDIFHSLISSEELARAGAGGLCAG
jgi:acyl-CoA dehydrogenase